MLGTRATVLPYRYAVDREHPMVGWWVAVHVEEPDCSCAWCSSAREDRELYVAFHTPAAILAAGDYLRSHPDEP